MKNTLLQSFFIFLSILFLAGCKNSELSTSTLISTPDELLEAISSAEPGSVITLKNGIWKDVEINLYGKGTEGKPITLRAETPGKVFIEGVSHLHLGGEYLRVDGLHFRNGYSPSRSVIRYQIGKDSTAFYSHVSNCVIDGFTKPNRYDRDSWVQFYGQHNQMDHCYISGKSSKGATVIVYQKGNQHINNYHQIVHNYFGPRPRKGGPSAETMRIGGSQTSMTPGRVNVANNYFEACNGEVEVISNKTNHNTFRNNIFYKCEGSLVMRHGNYTTVDGNIFIGDDDSDFYGGIRAVNTGHWITNNYFYKIRGEEFRSPLAMMNGIPKSPLNRYNQVTDVVVAHNTWIDCESPFQIGVGQNKASADVLPKSEIRSAPPIRCMVANNLIYNSEADKTPVVNHDDMDGISFYNNVIHNDGQKHDKYGVLRNEELSMTKVSNWLYAPSAGQGEILDTVYPGYGFGRIEKDVFGTSREKNNGLGAIANLTAAQNFKIDKSLYGPSWYSTEKEAVNPSILTASAAKGELEKRIEQAKNGDIIELTDVSYIIDESLKISKDLTIRSSRKEKVHVLYKGAADTPAIEMNPGGIVHLANIVLKGSNNQKAFAPLSENMSSAYNLFIDDCVIENFSHVLEASKGSFADSIIVNNTLIQNCENGFILAAEKKGEYNAEMVTFNNCEFKNVQKNVIHFFRGGYDESTIGGFLTLTNNSFTGCGRKESSGILVKTRGIINVFLTNNHFKNNPIKLVAVLWGAKNNNHKDNTLEQSGKIKIEEQQKLELLY